ncbi:MAG: LPXTG cell wall anchor domain-containing protein [Phaeodactylibacter sp.]|nr:LPXTG cell wall anchor domain-containing protein [Phaeodactylibacter sp.]MCB9266586.1 LPXTG cell wall anchor domain-containing protein [Lewinellaceae bacterium]MCB9288659.1 LPXTG cell wall anchor domain-containing protein [Lewinellaceae bacterium]
MRTLRQIWRKLWRRALVFSLSLLAFIAKMSAQAPEYGSSPYSDQKYDGASHSAWYQEPFLWAAAVLLLLLIGVLIARRRRKYT